MAGTWVRIGTLWYLLVRPVKYLQRKQRWTAWSELEGTMTLDLPLSLVRTWARINKV